MTTKHQNDDLRCLAMHDHPCSVYETAEELKSQFVPYLQSGLLLGERCIYFIDENDEQFVVDAMNSGGFDLQPYLDNGAFLVIHTRDAHLKGGYFAEDKMMAYWNSAMAEAKQAGFPAMRAAVEMTWALSGLPGCEILAPYEARLNGFTDANKVSVICQYHRRKFSPEKLKAVLHAHPIVVSGQSVFENKAVVPAERFVENSTDLDVQALLDNMELIKKLQNALQEKEAASLQLEKKRKECENLYQELHSLTRIMTHEMQAPLSVLTSYMRLLSVRYKDKLGADADEFIGKSVNAAKTVARMIDDLWTYARIDASDEPEETVDSAKVLEDVLEDLNGILTNVIVVHDKLPRISTCRSHLEFLFKALIENAISHSHTEKPRVKVGAKSINGIWQFSVSDNGNGLDPVEATDVFRMFNRLHKKPDETGTGMGLAIAKRIVDEHDGQIWFDSTAGQGATFSFTLPKWKGRKVVAIGEFPKRETKLQA